MLVTLMIQSHVGNCYGVSGTRRTQTGGEKKHFDLILGSDLIYVQSVIQPLFETVQVLLSTDDNSKFLMAHCSRREGNEVELPMVLDIAREQGFNFEVLSEDDDISLFCFRRRGPNANVG